MAKETSPLPEGLEALRKRFDEHSRKAQAYYAVMHAMRGIAGSDDAASLWMEQALPHFDGKTPAELVGAGCTDEVLAYISSQKSGSSI